MTSIYDNPMVTFKSLKKINHEGIRKNIISIFLIKPKNDEEYFEYAFKGVKMILKTIENTDLILRIFFDKSLDSEKKLLRFFVDNQKIEPVFFHSEFFFDKSNNCHKEAFAKIMSYSPIFDFEENENIDTVIILNTDVLYKGSNFNNNLTTEDISLSLGCKYTFYNHKDFPDGITCKSSVIELIKESSPVFISSDYSVYKNCNFDNGFFTLFLKNHSKYNFIHPIFQKQVKDFEDGYDEVFLNNFLLSKVKIQEYFILDFFTIDIFFYLFGDYLNSKQVKNISIKKFAKEIEEVLYTELYNNIKFDNGKIIVPRGKKYQKLFDEALDLVENIDEKIKNIPDNILEASNYISLLDPNIPFTAYFASVEQIFDQDDKVYKCEISVLKRIRTFS